MKLISKDVFKVENKVVLDTDSLSTLMLCYQPCIGQIATSLYLTLIAESQNQKNFESHQRICELLNIDINAFELARKKCEQYYLIKTYYKEDESKSSYVYALRTPLKADDFLNHDTFGRIYTKTVGTKQFSTTTSKLYKPAIDKTDFKDASEIFDGNLFNQWDENFELEFTKVKPTYTFNGDNESYMNFDFDLFLGQSTNLVFPIEVRNASNLKLIGELATTYGINEDRMRIIVGHSCNNSTKSIDLALLRRLAQAEKPTATEQPKNKYDYPPVVFLKNLQNGIDVTSVDKRLLEYLVTVMHLNHEVVNVLVEYVLKINDNKLTKAFTESIAASWVRSNVKTMEDALKQTQNGSIITKKSNVRKVPLPKDYEEDKKYVETKTISQDKLEELSARLKKLEG